MVEKTVNYTESMAAELSAAYAAADTEEKREAVISHFAGKFAKNVKSIRAKLVREGVYVKKAYKTKAGVTPERKAAIVQDIATALGASEDVIGSLEKATKKALELVRGALQS